MYNTYTPNFKRTLLLATAMFALFYQAQSQSLNLCYNCSSTTGDCAEPAISPNPDIVASCADLDIIFVLDESGSIAGAGAQPLVQAGVIAYLEALEGTGARVAFIDFADEAALVSDYLSVDSDYIDDIQGYFDGTPLNGEIYSAGGSTNWHSAFNECLTLDTAELVMFFTDGNPTSYLNSMGNMAHCTSTGTTEQPEIVNPMKIANFLKDSLGTHIFMLGVGSVNTDNLKKVSDTTQWQLNVNGVQTADYAIDNFASLATCLREFALDICGTDVSVTMAPDLDSLCAGGTVDIIMQVINIGTDNTGLGISVKDTFPAGFGSVACITDCADVCVGNGCAPAVGSNTLCWDVGDLNPGDTATITIRVTAVADGTLSSNAWATSSNVSTIAGTTSIVSHENPTADAGSNQTICDGGTTELVALSTTGTPPFSYEWSTTDSNDTINVTPLVNTTYFVTVTDAFQCTDVASITVNVTTDPDISITTQDEELCDGGTATLNTMILGGAGAPSFQWQIEDQFQVWQDIPGATLDSYISPTLTPGTYKYRVKLTQNAGCIDTSATAEINVFADPVVTISTGSPEVCVGALATISASVSGGTSRVQYQWQSSPDSSAWSDMLLETSSTLDAPTLVAGDTYYRVIVTDTSAGCSDPVSAGLLLSVNDDPVITMDLDQDDVCVGGSATISAIVSGGTPTLAYQWQSSPDGIIGWADLPGEEQYQYSPPTNLAGVYHYRAVISDGSPGCATPNPEAVVLRVNEDPAPDIDVTNGDLCVGGVVTLEANITGGSGLLDYFWQSSPNGVDTWTDVGVSNTDYLPSTAASGTFYYRLRIDDTDSGCDEAESNPVTVTIGDTVTVMAVADSDEVCVGGIVNLQAGISGGSTMLHYHWQSSPNGMDTWTDVGVSDMNLSPPTNTDTILYYRLRIEDDGSGCIEPESAAVTIVVHEDVDASASADNAEVCVDGSVTLSAAITGGSSLLEYHWQTSPDGIGSWTDAGVMNSDFSPSTSSSGTYYARLRIEDASSGCGQSFSLPTSYLVNDDAVVAAMAADDTVCVNDLIVINANITGGSSLLEYFWQTSTNGINSWTDLGINNQALQFAATQEGTFYYRFRTVDTVSGCAPANAAAVEITVFDIPLASVSYDDPFCGLFNGTLTMTFADDPTRTDVEFSLNDQGSYLPPVPDNSGSVTYYGLAPGTYHIWARWTNEDCPVPIDTVELENITCGTICGNVEDNRQNPISGVQIDLYLDTNGDGNADGAPIASRISDGDAGSFCFEDIPEGDYVLVENQPPFYDDVSDYDRTIDSIDTDGVDTLFQLADNDIPVTLTELENDDGNLFVDIPHPGTISGYVMDDRLVVTVGATVYLFEDINADGQSDGPFIASTPTNGVGYYQFTGVIPGAYVLEADQPLYYSNESDIDTSITGTDLDGDDGPIGDNDIPVLLSPGEIDADNIFIDGRFGSICGNVRTDLLVPVEGVTIELFPDVDLDGNADSVAVASVVTDSLGDYCFDNVTPAPYVLVQTQPAFYDDVSDYDHSITIDDPDGLDTAGMAADNDIPVVLAPGEIDADNDFIEDAQFGDITGKVYNDIGNPISFTTIELYLDTDGDGDKDGIALQSAVTNGSGEFSFIGLEPKDYVLVESHPFFYTSIFDRDTSINAFDLDGDDSLDGPDDEIPVRLSPGEIDADNHFKEGRYGNICGTVYDDLFNPISNVVIYLYVDVNANGIADDGPPSDSTLTDGDTGNYCFSDLEAGDYVIVEVQPDNYDDVSDVDGSVDSLDSDGFDGALPDNDIPVTLAFGEDDLNNDFVEDPHVGNILGSVIDEIGDPIDGVELILYADYDQDGNADGAALDTTWSNLAGDYVFSGLEPFGYVVVETQPANYSSISDFDVTPDPDGNDNGDGADNDIPVVVRPGEDDEDNDFVDGSPGSICGNVRDDRGRPIGGVTLKLYADTDSNGVKDGPVLSTVQSDSASGNYCFNELLPDDYVIVEEQPANYDDAFDFDQTVGAMDPDGDDSGESADNDIPVTLAPGESDSGNDFVEDPHKGLILGEVQNDAGEGIQGVTIKLYVDADFDKVPDGAAERTVVTNSDGEFFMFNVEPDDYVLIETQPFLHSSISDYDHTPDPDGDDSASGPDDAIPLTLLPAEFDLNNIFIDGRPGEISGVVLTDLSQPISFVKIWLYQDDDLDGEPDGSPLDSTYTEPDAGAYVFSDIVPQGYVVVEEQPLTYGDLEDYDRMTGPQDLDGDDRSEGVDNNIPVILTANEVDNGNDFIDIECPDAPITTNDTSYVLCDGEVLAFVAESQNLGSETYEWDFGSGATPATASGIGPHLVSYDTTSENTTTGTVVTLTVTKVGCGSPQVGQVSTVTVRPTPDATIDGETTDHCWYADRTFRPAEAELPGATYTWDFGAGASPANAVGYGPHDVQYLSIGSKVVELTIDLPHASGVCTDIRTLSFDIISCLGNISGGVYADSIDGVPLDGIPIALYPDMDIDGLPDSGSIATFTFTTSSGNFAFALLTPGNYVIQELQPSEYISLSDGDVSPDGDLAANVDLLDDIIPVTVKPLITDGGNFFIETLKLGTVSGSVFEDFNDDELPDEDEGIPDVKLYIFSDSDRDGIADNGTAVDSAITIANGSFSVAGLDTGAYVLVEVQPEGYDNTRDFDPTGDGDQVINTNELNDTIPFTLFAGEHDSDNYFIETTQCTKVVVNTDDDGQGSLRFAIDCATSGDTIRFDAALAGDTIFLSSEKLVIQKHLTIYSELDPKIVVMSNVDGLIEVISGQTVEINNIVLIGSPDSDPAAIEVAAGGILKLEDVQLVVNPLTVNPSAHLILNRGTLRLRGDNELEK